MATRNSALEYLTTTNIGEKGQLTVPKQFREDLRLTNGAPFAVLRLGDGLILLPEQKRFEDLCAKISARLASARINSKEILSTLPDSRERVYSRRYGKLATARAIRQTAGPRRKK